jgi:hypothetical protein
MLFILNRIAFTKIDTLPVRFKWSLKLENIKCTILGLYNAKQVDSVPLSEFTLLGIHMLPLFSLQVNLISNYLTVSKKITVYLLFCDF